MKVKGRCSRRRPTSIWEQELRSMTHRGREDNKQKETEEEVLWEDTDTEALLSEDQMKAEMS
jgi:hypothetical protein